MQNVLGIGVQKIVTDFGEISLVLDRYADTKTNLDGILDVADTKLNDVASNLALAQEEIPLLGGVSIG